MTIPKRLIFSLISVLVITILVEAAARVTERFLVSTEIDHQDTGWQTAFFSRHFDWHQPDPELLWRFRANLRTDYISTDGEGLIGEAVIRPRPDSVYRILLLGDSSPVGLGLPDYRQAFGHVLRDLLQGEFGDARRVDLANAAVAGYSSEQVRRWFELYASEYQPNLIVVYVGNNDASISGTVTDAELLVSQKVTVLRTLLGKSATYRLLRLMLVSHADATSADPNLLTVRVDPKRYARNITEIVSASERRMVPVVVVKPIVPYLWPAGLQFKVFERMRTGKGALLLPEPVRQILGRQVKYCIDWTDFNRRYGQADWYTRAVYGSAFSDDMSPGRAVEYYTGELESSPDDPVIINNIGVSLWEGGQLEAARRYLDEAGVAFLKQHPPPHNPAENSAGAVFPYNSAVSWLGHVSESGTPADTSHAVDLLRRALSNDYLSLRIKDEYNLALREELAAMAANNWIMVSLDSAFGRGADSPLGAENMFIDHCHPVAEGHRRIAATILSELRQTGWLDSLQSKAGSP